MDQGNSEGARDISGISDGELITRLPKLVGAERNCTAEVIEHLMEVDRRRLYLDQACESLSAFCCARLGYSEDEAAKRVRVTRLARHFPQVLEELRSGELHLTGLYLLSRYITPDNYEALVSEARGKSKRQIEELIARNFPRPDVPERLALEPMQLSVPGVTGPGAGGVIGPAATEVTGPGAGFDSVRVAALPSRLAPLSAVRWSVQFTASAEFHQKIERARELLSHALPSGDLAELFERALDELIERETKRREGARKPRQRRLLRDGSRHVPIEIARQVRQRDGNQCTFFDESGRRCRARRFLTFEHRTPFALGGPATVDNLCLLCMSHNQALRRKVFGDKEYGVSIGAQHIEPLA